MTDGYQVYPTREAAAADMRAYIAHHNSSRPHTTPADLTLIELEQSAQLGVRLSLTTTAPVTICLAQTESDTL